jgi:hypothetical protein
MTLRASESMLGFTISLLEYEATIPTLWTHVKSASSSELDRIMPC